MNPLHKVTVFITRETPEGRALALFQHPYAGIQIPAGTVETGEEPEEAARREAMEETGLRELRLARSLGSRVETLPVYQRVVLNRTTVYARPEPDSFDWATLPRGATVSLARVTGQFSHVTYIEYDDVDNPRYVTYQITGWAPTDCLTDQHVRHFFHYEYQGEQVEPWEVETDNHRFRVFWAPAAKLPTIVEPQQQWLKMFL